MNSAAPSAPAPDPAILNRSAACAGVAFQNAGAAYEGGDMRTSHRSTLHDRCRLKAALACFVRSKAGTTTIEYALVAALVGVGLIAGASKIDPGFTSVEADISAAIDFSK